MKSSLLPIDQSGCDGNPYDANVRPMVRLAHDTLTVQGLSNRCSQRLEARAKRRGDTLVVMIQPADLKPTVVAKCSCLYTVRVQLPRDDGWGRLRVVTRGDHYGRSAPPTVLVLGEIDRAEDGGSPPDGSALPHWHIGGGRGRRS